MTLYQRFSDNFRKAYKKSPESLFCRAVISTSRLIQPYKSFLQSSLAPYKNYKYRKVFSQVLNTAPVSCRAEADCEIHTLTSHGHVFMYLAALKSFLRFYGDVAVTVHDDGSLTVQDKIMLAAHIKGIRIIEKKNADEQMSDYLENFPHCKIYREKFINAIQLLDFFMLSDSQKIILLDSDVLFFQEPSEIIEWIHAKDKEELITFEDAPKQQKDFLDSLNCGFPPHMCIGLGCLHKDVFDLSLIEDLLRQAAPQWGLDWWTGQNIFPVLLNNKSGEYRTSFLDKNKYQAFYYPLEEGVIFRHYVSSTYFSRFDRQLSDAQKVFLEI